MEVRKWAERAGRRADLLVRNFLKSKFEFELERATMKPQDLATGSEDGEQAALFCWAARLLATGEAYAKPLEYMFAIPNGGTRGGNKQQAMSVGAKLKATGVKKGVSDIMLPWPAHGLNGLFIEMKKAPEFGGKQSDASPEQKAFIVAMRANGYGALVCCGWVEASRVICQWLDLEWELTLL